MRRRTFAALALIIVAACSDVVPDADPWSLGEGSDAGADTAPTPDAGPGVDQSRPDPDTTPPPPRPECVHGRLEVFDVPTWGRDMGLVVAGDRVFVSGILAGRMDADVLEWRDQGLTTFAATDGVADRAIDGTAQFLWTVGGSFRRHELPSGQTTRELSVAAPAGSYYFDFAQPRKYAHGDLLSWMDGADLFMLSETGVNRLGRAQSGPWVGAGGVAWFNYDEVWRIHFTDLTGRDHVLVAGAEFAGWPVLLGDHVVFVQDGEIWSWVPETGEVTAVIEGRSCGPLHTDGNLATTACRAEPSPLGGAAYLDLGATEVWEIEAGSLRSTRVHVTDGTEIIAPVINDRWLAWLEHEPMLVTPDGPAGTVMVLARGAEAPIAAARVGRGCWTCGAYWPPPILDLGTDTLAFNYAIGPNDPPVAPTPDNGGFAGVLRLSTVCLP